MHGETTNLILLLVRNIFVHPCRQQLTTDDSRHEGLKIRRGFCAKPLPPITKQTGSVARRGRLEGSPRRITIHPSCSRGVWEAVDAKPLVSKGESGGVDWTTIGPPAALPHHCIPPPSVTTLDRSCWLAR